MGVIELKIRAFQAQISRFELFERILLLKSDKQFPAEQFEAVVSQSTVPSPPPRTGEINLIITVVIVRVLLLLLLLLLSLLSLLLFQEAAVPAVTGPRLGLEDASQAAYYYYDT